MRMVYEAVEERDGELIDELSEMVRLILTGSRALASRSAPR